MKLAYLYVQYVNLFFFQLTMELSELNVQTIEVMVLSIKEK